MRNLTKSALLTLALVFITSLFLVSPNRNQALQRAYVEPGLYSQAGDSLSVILSGDDSDRAARAVAAMGGQVTSELWLINAVAATVPSDQLEALAAYPGINSIVSNKRVTTAGESSGNGWVTNRRAKNDGQQLESKQDVPAVYLPDGGYFSPAENGKHLIANADGSPRAWLALGNGPFKTQPAVGPDGTIYLTGENKVLYALNPDGSTRWVFQGSSEKFFSGVSLGSDGTIYTVDEKRNIYALDPASGQLLWKVFLGGDGIVKAALTVGSDGNLYLLSDKGYLFAVDPGGTLLWTFIAPGGAPYRYSPLVGQDGMVYIAGEEGQVYAINPGGTQNYKFVVDGKIKARPVLAATGDLFVPSEKGRLYGLAPDGSQRFVFSVGGDHFRSSPLLSMDGSTLYCSVEEGYLVALNTSDGTEQWRFVASGKIKDSPALDPDGNLIFGSEGKDLNVLDPDGQLISQLTMDDKVLQTPAVNPVNGDALVRVGDANQSLVPVTVLPDYWAGNQDVQPTDNQRVWKLAYPVVIDAGADIVHQSYAPDGELLDGRGVTVALVDSGVFFDKHTKDVLGKEVKKLFRGQADFVGNGSCQGKGGHQKDHYCYRDGEQSQDDYGHGSHVAGIIWSNYIDYATGVKVGIAPEANVLSVRVLGDDGSGAYEDVIEGIQYVVENKDELNIRVMNLSLSATPTTPYFADPLNRAVEKAWEAGIVVVVAAGNTGPGAETITVPGNDPYVITVGTVDGNHTAGFGPMISCPTGRLLGQHWMGSQNLIFWPREPTLSPSCTMIIKIPTNRHDWCSSILTIRTHPICSA